MSGRDEDPTALLVYPDYGCCLWWLEPAEEQPEGLGPGCVDPEDLQLPAELTARVRDWIKRFWNLVDGLESADPYCDDGRALAIELKRFYGPDVRIDYDCGAGRGERVEITG